MCVKVFLADDSELIRKGIRMLLANREEIVVVGESSNFDETIQKTAELHPDLIIFDVRLATRNHVAPNEIKNLLNGAKVLAISFGIDGETRALADNFGAAKFLDKMELSKELIPAILELAPEHSKP